MSIVIAAFQLRGRVKAVLVGREGDSVSTEVAKIQVSPDWGVKGDGHGWHKRLLDVREKGLLAHGIPKGVEIANARQVSITSVEETEAVRLALDLPAPIPHGLLCENLVLEGIHPLTSLPMGTMLLFQKPDGSVKRTAAIVIWGENTPCVVPGGNIRRYFETHFTLDKGYAAGLPAAFVKQARGRRGVTATGYCSGFIHAGDEVLVCVPEQRLYLPPTPVTG